MLCSGLSSLDQETAPEIAPSLSYRIQFPPIMVSGGHLGCWNPLASTLICPLIAPLSEPFASGRSLRGHTIFPHNTRILSQVGHDPPGHLMLISFPLPPMIKWKAAGRRCPFPGTESFGCVISGIVTWVFFRGCLGDLDCTLPLRKNCLMSRF